jgi:hypothetical protein
MTDQAAPAADNPQAAQGRHDAISHLLFRAACGVLKAEEGALLRSLVEQERDAGDSLAGGVSASAATYARRYEQAAERLRKAREQRKEARAEAAEHKTNYLGACKTIAAMHAAAVGEVCGPRRGVVEDVADLRAERDSLRQQLAAAKAEAEGLAETMRNTDRLTEQQLGEARARADNLGEQFRARRHALSQALGLGTSAPWDAIAERARELADDDATHTTCVRQLGEATDSIKALRDQHDRHRHTLAVVLDLDADTEWPTIVQQAGAARAHRADWARCRSEAERGAAADVAAARQAEDSATSEHARRRQQLADALGCNPDTSWPDIAETARRMFEAGPVRRAAVVDAEQHRRRLAAILAKQADTPFAELTEYAAQSLTRAGERILAAKQERQAARQAEAEAVRARQAAEQREQQTAATLRETETQLGQARQRAEVWRVDAATQGQIVKQCTEERDRHAATIERMKRTNRMVNGGARDARERAERAESTLAAVSRQCEDWAKPSTALTFESKRRDAAVATAAGILLDLIRTEGRAEHTCPDGEPCPAHDQPAEPKPTPPPVPDGEALWAAIKDHAARDTAWWDRIERAHRSRPARFPVSLR